MRKLIDIVTVLNERVVADYSNPFDPQVSYEIHKNGSRRDLFKLMSSLHPENTSRDVRAILAPNGDLYFFDGWAAAHAGIKSHLAITGLHLNLYADHVGVGWGRRSPTRELFDQAVREVQKSQRIIAIYGPDVKVEPMVDIIEPTPPREY